MTAAVAQCSLCGKGLAQADILYTPRADVVCAGCHDKVMDASRGTKLPAVLIAAAVLAFVPFVISAASVETVNGRVVHYRDWVAIVMGVAAIATAGWNLLKDRSTLAMAGGAAVLLVGMYDIGRGLGIL